MEQSKDESRQDERRDDIAGWMRDPLQWCLALSCDVDSDRWHSTAAHGGAGRHRDVAQRRRSTAELNGPPGWMETAGDGWSSGMG